VIRRVPSAGEQAGLQRDVFVLDGALEPLIIVTRTTEIGALTTSDRCCLIDW
jgi:hypothetical protein